MKLLTNTIALVCLLAIWSPATYAQRANTNPASSENIPPSNADLILNAIDDSAVAQFKNAWRSVGSGADDIEATVLLYGKLDGSLEARLAPMTYQFQRFEFGWNAAIFGVVHTHPNCLDFRPSAEDLRVANRFHVPVFTITSRGMYVYDPEKNKISRVQRGLDWLDRSKWHLNSVLSMKR